MIPPLEQPPLSAWEREGERLGPELDVYHSAVVIGADASAAAEVALGIGRVQARHRRVAVGDVVGDLPPIAQLVPDDAEYGLVDSFLYGVSLNKVAHPIGAARNLLILPSGAAPIDHDAIIRSERWQRLTFGFREASALLLIVASEGTDPASELIARVDGVVLVGDVAAPSGARVLARALLPDAPSSDAPAERASDRESTLAPGSEPELASAGEAAREADREPANEPDREPDREPEHEPEHELRREPSHEPELARAGGTTTTRVPTLFRTTEHGTIPTVPRWVGVAAVALVAVAGIVWAAQRFLPATRRVVPNSTAIAAHSAAGGLSTDPADPASVTSAAASDGAAPSSRTSPGARTPPAGAAAPGARSAATAIDSSALAITNDADSASATAYGVELVEFGSVTAANSRLEQEAERGLPAITFAPAPSAADGGRLMYGVIAGAYPDRAGAVALLRSLRARRILAPGDGHVVRAPIALLVERGVTPDQLSFFTNGYRLKGLPVYALIQNDGTVNLYAGAFATSEDAKTLLATFRANGDEPRVAYRTGRIP